jgi:hypothetical protein
MRLRVVLALASFSLVLLSGAAVAGERYGQGVTLKQTTAVSALLDKPEESLGKTVAVKGLIVDVCSTRGCWMEIAGDKPFGKLRVKVDDGVIVFPLSAKGRTATVQGKLEEAASEGAKADEPFPGFTPAEGSCANCPENKLAAKPRSWQLRATGAIVE